MNFLRKNIYRIVGIFMLLDNFHLEGHDLNIGCFPQTHNLLSNNV